MAKLKDMRVNARLLRDGDWVEMGEDWDGLRLKVRGQARTYFDARAMAEQRLAAKHGGEIANVPAALLDEAYARCVGEHLLLDVADLEDEAGPVAVARYRELMLDPDNLPLVSAVLVASDRLARRARAEARQAEGNSATSSAGG